MMPPPDLTKLTEAEKDALILTLWAQVQSLTARVAELEARLNQPPKTSGNSSLPPSKSHKTNRPEKAKRTGPRQGSLGRAGGGRSLAEEPDQLGQDVVLGRTGERKIDRSLSEQLAKPH